MINNNESLKMENDCGHLSNETKTNEKMKLDFYLGPIGSAIPILFFIIWAIVSSFLNICNEQSLIVGAVLGLALGLLVCKDSAECYVQAITQGMTQTVAAIAIIAWFWAGMFASILQAGGLVEGLVWLGVSTGVKGSLFTAVTFILSAVFGTAVGTGYGTLVAFSMLMYPVGILMGAHPVVLLGAILSGSAFGDNLAPVSDTTIISATTQETEVMGVVRSRFRYSFMAGIIALSLFLIFGGAESDIIASSESMNMLNQYINPKGLILLIPFALVLLLAFRGHHLIVSLSWGIVTAILIIVISGLGSFQDILYFNIADGKLQGAIADGVYGYLHMCVLLLLIMASGYLVTVGNMMSVMEKAIIKRVNGAVKKAELAIWGIVTIFNTLMGVNAAAEITAAPFVRSVGKAFKIHPYRRANMLDAITAAGGFIFPWSGGILLGVSIINGLTEKYDFITKLTPAGVVPYVFHGWALVIIMLFAAITSWGLRYEGLNGQPVKEKPKIKYKKFI